MYLCQRWRQVTGQFSIEHDEIQRSHSSKETMAASGNKLNLFASPGARQPWMKDNNDMLHGGKLKPEFFESWACILPNSSKLINQGRYPPFGHQHQRMNHGASKMGKLYLHSRRRDFLKNHLGPVMEKEGLKDTKIIVWDHNRDMIDPARLTYLSDPETRKYIWGISFTWV